MWLQMHSPESVKLSWVIIWTLFCQSKTSVLNCVCKPQVTASTRVTMCIVYCVNLNCVEVSEIYFTKNLRAHYGMCIQEKFCCTSTFLLRGEVWWAQCLVYEYKILIMLDHFNHSSRTRNNFAKVVPLNSFDYVRPVSLIESQLPARWIYQVKGCSNACECKHLVWYINDGLLSVEKLYFYM